MVNYWKATGIEKSDSGITPFYHPSYLFRLMVPECKRSTAKRRFICFYFLCLIPENSRKSVSLRKIVDKIRVGLNVGYVWNAIVVKKLGE